MSYNFLEMQVFDFSDLNLQANNRGNCFSCDTCDCDNHDDGNEDSRYDGDNDGFGYCDCDVCDNRW